MPFQKSSDLKSLDIRDAWRLYNHIRPGITHTKNGYLIDDILEMMDHLDEFNFKESLRIMYGDTVNWLKQTPIDVALLFTKGIKSARIFDLHDFIKAVLRVPS